mgnify:CR=1 FL=1
MKYVMKNWMNKWQKEKKIHLVNKIKWVNKKNNTVQEVISLKMHKKRYKK